MLILRIQHQMSIPGSSVLIEDGKRLAADFMRLKASRSMILINRRVHVTWLMLGDHNNSFSRSNCQLSPPGFYSWMLVQIRYSCRHYI